jgi:hypothetical protein
MFGKKKENVQMCKYANVQICKCANVNSLGYVR